MKKYQLASCTSPSVTFEIGGHIIQSDVIKNTKKNPNFAKNSFFLDVVSLSLEILLTQGSLFIYIYIIVHLSV